MLDDPIPIPWSSRVFPADLGNFKPYNNAIYQELVNLY